MQLPENVVPMPVEKRAELKRLAEAAWPGPWATSGPEYSAIGHIWHNGKLVGQSHIPPNAAYIAAVSPDVALATLAYVEALEAQVAKSEAQAQRLEPLVRYMRVELHEAKLIDNREYADLCQLGGSHVLDSYDALRERAEKAESALTEARQELADQEAEKLSLVQELDRKTRLAQILSTSNTGLRQEIDEQAAARVDEVASILHDLKEAYGEGEWSNIRYMIQGLEADAEDNKASTPSPLEGEAKPGHIYFRHEVEYGKPAEGAGIPVEPALRMTQLPSGHIFPPCWPCPGCLATKPSECLGTACLHYHPDNTASTTEPAGLSSTFDDGWYPKEVFDSAAEYDASVQRNIEKAASGEVKPIEQEEDSPTYDEVAAAADRAGWGKYMLTREVFDRMSLDMRKLLFADIVSGRLKDKIMNALNLPGAPLEGKAAAGPITELLFERGREGGQGEQA
jgi:dsDNA-binding SOS-regulon protein